MGLKSKFWKLSNTSSRFKFLLFEAFFVSIKNEFLLRRNVYQPIKELHNNFDEEQDITPEKFLLMREISTVIKLLEKYAPWKPMCYNRALTAKGMLLKRNIRTNMHIGFKKTKGEFDGHAWLTFNDKLVTGKVKGLHKFKVLKPTLTV